MGNKRRDRASGVVIKGEMTLLIKRVKPGEIYYVFPGGGIESNESPRQAVIREIKEETNLDIEEPEELFSLDDSGTGKNYFFFSRNFSRDTLKFNGPEIQHEGNQYIPMWVPLSDLSRLTLYPSGVGYKVLKCLEKFVYGRQDRQ